MFRRARHARTRSEDAARLLPGRAHQVAFAVAAVLFLALPYNVEDFWLEVLARCGVSAVGAIALTLLTGYAGQVSLGHAFFLGVGAYVAAWFGVQQEWPLLLWLPTCALVGGALGALVGPFALRLRGNYLAIVTVGLLYVGEHVFDNWDTVTGGPSGTSTAAPVAIGPWDFADLELFGEAFTRRQSMFWLVWAVVGIAALVARNMARTRPGRALQAVRDRDVAAEVVGVSLARYKVGVFAVSSAMAAVAGGLYGVVQQFVSPGDFGGAPGLALSITFVAMIIVGGIGTVSGALIGALLVTGFPRVIERVGQSTDLPLISGDAGGTEGVLSVFAFNQIVFGLAIVVFLVLEPRGIVAVLRRARTWLGAWPYSAGR